MLTQAYDVLVIETDQNRLSWITSSLELLGCLVVTARTIKLGITALAQGRFDLVLFNQNYSSDQFLPLEEAVNSLHHPFHNPTLLAALGNKNSDLPAHLANLSLAGRLTYPSTINTVGKSIAHWLSHNEMAVGRLIPDSHHGFSYQIDPEILSINPIQSNSTEPSKTKTGESAADQPTPAKREVESLLLVDDDPISLEISQDHLEAEGFTVITANNGIEAISKICQRLPGLVIINADLPGLSGYQVCEQIRGLDQAKQLPVIIVLSESASAKPAIDLQINACFNKPLNWSLLIDQITNIFREMKTNSQLQQVRQRFTSIQNLANIGYIDFDLQTQTGYTSETFWKIIGHEPSGKFSLNDFNQIVHPEDREKYSNNVRTSTRTNGVMKSQYRIIDAAGKTKTLLSTRIITLNKKGQLTNFESVVQDITDQINHQQNIRRISRYDELTGFYNPLAFRDEIQHAITMHRSFAAEFSLLMIDLNNFNRIKDKFGATGSDQVVSDFSNRLQKIVIDSTYQAEIPLKPVFARDDEHRFGMLIKANASRALLTSIAEKIADTLLTPFFLKQSPDAPKQEIFLTSSTGIVEFPKDGDTIELLESNAKIAVNDVAQSSKSGFRFFTPALITASKAGPNLETALKDAIQREQLALHFLPTNRLATGQVEGFEALLRWHHPEIGAISPVKIIELAEATGMITQISDWVFDLACRQLAQWHHSEQPGLSIAINLSSLQFTHQKLAESVSNAITRYQIDPSYLQIELTENTLMVDIDQTLKTLNQLKAIGVQISVDDFGSGCSSLAALHHFPIDNLKIDREFVRSIDQPSENPGVTDAIIAMGKSLGINLIAEGIETQTQLNYLNNQDCQSGQGYFFSKPLTAAAATSYLQQSAR